jgi:hypothetical protein
MRPPAIPSASFPHPQVCDEIEGQLVRNEKIIFEALNERAFKGASRTGAKSLPMTRRVIASRALDAQRTYRGLVLEVQGG